MVTKYIYQVMLTCNESSGILSSLHLSNLSIVCTTITSSPSPSPPLPPFIVPFISFPPTSSTFTNSNHLIIPSILIDTFSLAEVAEHPSSCNQAKIACACCSSMTSAREWDWPTSDHLEDDQMGEGRVGKKEGDSGEGERKAVEKMKTG